MNLYDLKLNRYKMFLISLLFVYKICLDIIYVQWLNPIYGYIGFVLNISIYKIIISYLLTILLIIIIPKHEKKISYIVLQIHLIIMILPTLTLYSLGGFSAKFLFMIIFCFILQIFLIRILPTIKLIKIKKMKYFIFIFLFFTTVFVYYYLLKTFNIHWNAINLSVIYKIRANQNISNGIMKYLITWQYRMINPIIIVLSYYSKRRKITTFTIIMQLLLYLIIPHKEIFLSAGLILMVIFVNKYKYNFISFFTAFITLGSFLFSIIYDLFNISSLVSILPMRFLYIPALVKFQHYEFFSSNPKLLYSEGRIGDIFNLTYPYSMPSGFVVTQGVNNANTGYLAYGFDNFGFLGMILISIFFCFCNDFVRFSK
ncbi:hypothetical protein DER71_10636 [Halanaerobium sp. DL-01]|uniref:hypothetical protein n=1 Tax=Halanaerobium sp. DL-01 TaxID=1653064 RepID=UPI000DF38B8F|nr:hypothetical protein [Halanaerobium sp. DL-01]RCW86928.1 hypothetical protein DER71_10636 [Halanaerobium sp. DL-01]